MHFIVGYMYHMLSIAYHVGLHLTNKDVFIITPSERGRYNVVGDDNVRVCVGVQTNQ